MKSSKVADRAIILSAGDPSARRFVLDEGYYRKRSLWEVVDERRSAPRTPEARNPTTPTDYEQIATRYDTGKYAPPDALGAWRVALAPFVGRKRLPLLDVGCGTGYWAVALADWFGLRIVAVEPSQEMRKEAQRKRRDPRVWYLGGRAESLPLTDGACESAWLSTVVHHISDLGECARELRRVLAQGGRVIIRNPFSGRTDGIPWLRYFEHVRHVSEARWPTVDYVVGAFEQVGFGLEHLQPVEQIAAVSLSSYARRIGTRVDSTLAAVSDDDFERGMNNLKEAAASELEPKPVVTRLDLLVLKNDYR